ncbi:Uma2 family endonuclease [Gemmata sp.]|uniref:Uma2 family endonuclease n=1 Tax=Gemmata sp. TaxID=1914242 RepID=UPI003F72E759
MTPTTTPDPAAAQPRRRKPGRAVRIANVPWDMYESVLKAFGDKRGIRVTYDRGELEIMVPSFDHDRGDRLLAMFVPILAEELGVPVLPGGSTTLKLKKVMKGIEADDIFWLANAAKLAGVRDLDLTVHPPPDLAIEVDVSRSSMKRLAIYRKLGVPEVWRLKDDTLTFHVLSGKKYQIASHSRSFPLVASADLVTFVKRGREAGDQTPLYRAVRAWARQLAAKLPQ